MDGASPARLRCRGPQARGQRRATPRRPWIFGRFLEIGSATEWRGNRGAPRPHEGRRLIDKKYRYRLLNRPCLRRGGVDKVESYPASTTRSSIARHGTAFTPSCGRARGSRRADRAETPVLLKGLLFGPTARHSRRRTPERAAALPLLCQPDRAEARRRVVPGRPRACGRDRGRRHRPAPRRIPPARDRGGDWKAARAHADDISEADARAALQQLDPLWDDSSPPSRRVSWRCWSSAWTSAPTG